MLHQTERGQAGLNWPSGTPICLAVQANVVPKWDKCGFSECCAALRRRHVSGLGWMSQWWQHTFVFDGVLSHVAPVSGSIGCWPPLPNECPVKYSRPIIE